MSFWQDASPLVKGALVVGGLLILYFALSYPLGLWPNNSQVGDAVQQERGFHGE
jgi:hypothetical protein